MKQQTSEERKKKIEELEQEITALKAMEKEILEKDLRELAASLIAEFEKLDRSAWVYETDDWKIIIRKGTGKEVDEDNNCKDKRESFISKLTSSGCIIQNVKSREYIIDGKKVNIRCRNKEKTISGNKCFWYSVEFNVLEEVDYVIYLTPDSYIRFPSDFLRKIKDRMYRPHDGRYMGVFDIDCDDLSIILKNGREDIDKYYYHLP